MSLDSQSKVPTMMLSQSTVNILDYAMIGISGFVFLSSLFIALYSALHSWGVSRGKTWSNEFNSLWRARIFSQVLAAMYALSLLLRLQILWGPASILVSGGYNATLFCRLFVGICYGVFEPAFLLLALFSCVFVLQGKEEASQNMSIVLFALGFTLPVCAAQVLCAIFTHVIESSAFGSWIYMTFFSTFDSGEISYCLSYSSGDNGTGSNSTLGNQSSTPPSPPSPPMPAPFMTGSGILVNCAFCVFPLLSTSISVAFASIYLLVAWRVTERVIDAVLNKRLIRRIRVMQIMVLVTVPLGIACRGVSVLFVPFDLAFEVLRCSDVVCIAITVLSISYTLVLRPTYDSRMTDKAMRMSPNLAFGASWVEAIDSSAEEDLSSEAADRIGTDLLRPPQELSREEDQTLSNDQIQVESREVEEEASPQSPSTNREGRDLNDTARVREGNAPQLEEA